MNELKEIIDNSSPLMEVFKDKAPGTFRHCMTVASLIEPIAGELDLEVEKMVVAAKLHDIGKSFSAEWFTENQNADNPHDDADPVYSYCVISRHVSDGVLKLIQYPEIPREVITWISEHHGDTVIQSIYNKAKEKYNGSTSIEAYRYKCRKPSCIESAVLMICDVVEATLKSLHNNDKLEDVKGTIDKMIDSLIEDEQLDQLKIGDIRIIKKVLVREAGSIYHKRIDYEDEDNGNGEDK
jgi:putative nucleotidyltransferase with HDIG domain